MRILHVTGVMNIGGTETMLINLYKKINKNIIFDFISYGDEEGYYDEEIKNLGGKIIKLESPAKRGLLGSIKDIRSVIKKNGPYNAIHTHMMFNCGVAMIAGFISGIKIRVSHAHTTADNSESLIRRIYICTMRVIIRIFSTKFLACSNGAAKYLFGEDIIDNKKYKILPNYIDYSQFIRSENKESLRQELKIEDDDIVITHIGRFIPVKNHIFLIDIIHEMIQNNKNIKLVLVGIGDLQEKIKNRVKEYGIENNIYFLNIRKDISNILHSTDLFILPSISEGLGLVLLEAQASNVRCLVSEAIQPEVDLGVGLINTIRLDESPKIWAKTAFNILDKKKSNTFELKKAIKNKRYDLNSIINILSNIYKINLDVSEEL